MFGRFEGLCLVTMASWFAGLAIGFFMNPRQGGELVVVLGLGLIGLMAAPAIGIRLVMILSDFAEWESWGVRDFYPAGLALSVPVCFGISLALCSALGG
jgi:hypothetical protein